MYFWSIPTLFILPVNKQFFTIFTRTSLYEHTGTRVLFQSVHLLSERWCVSWGNPAQSSSVQLFFTSDCGEAAPPLPPHGASWGCPVLPRKWDDGDAGRGKVSTVTMWRYRNEPRRSRWLGSTGPVSTEPEGRTGPGTPEEEDSEGHNRAAAGTWRWNSRLFFIWNMKQNSSSLLLAVSEDSDNK